MFRIQKKITHHTKNQESQIRKDNHLTPILRWDSKAAIIKMLQAIVSSLETMKQRKKYKISTKRRYTKSEVEMIQLKIRKFKTHWSGSMVELI